MAIAQGRVGVPHFTRAHLLGDFDGPHVAGLLDHPLHRQHTVVVGVIDGEPPHRVPTGPGVDDRVRRDAAGIQRHGHGDGFHGRARLKRVGQRAVAELFATEVFTPVGVVRGVVGQRQHLTGVHIHYYHAASFSLVRFNRFAQFLVCKKLYFAVNRQLKIRSIDRRNGIAHVFDDATQAVFDDAAGTWRTRQLRVEGEFNTFLPHIFHIGEAHNVCCGFAFGILALVVFAQVDALHTQGIDLFGDRFVYLALDPHKRLVFI